MGAPTRLRSFGLVKNRGLVAIRNRTTTHQNSVTNNQYKLSFEQKQSLIRAGVFFGVITFLIGWWISNNNPFLNGAADPSLKSIRVTMVFAACVGLFLMASVSLSSYCYLRYQPNWISEDRFQAGVSAVSLAAVSLFWLTLVPEFKVTHPAAYEGIKSCASILGLFSIGGAFALFNVRLSLPGSSGAL